MISSPFPGMDPYLEMVEWQDFHLGMINSIRRQLSSRLRPKYFARIERRVYVERHFDEVSLYIADVEIVRTRRGKSQQLPEAAAASAGAVATLEPRVYEVPAPQEHREPYLVIRDLARRNVVTVVELLSPTNKAPGSDGARLYADKRAEILESRTNLVEIDLLRAGRRPPTTRPLPATVDYCVFVHRAKRRGQAEVYEWTIRDPLPTVPLPLQAPDADVPLNLEQAFQEVFDEAGYDLELPYGKPLSPRPRKSDLAWIRKVVSNWRTHRDRDL